MSGEEKAEKIQRKLFRSISAEITDRELDEIKEELKQKAFGGFKAGEIQRQLKTVDDVLEKLKRKGLIKIGEYEILRKLAEAIDSQPIRDYVAQAENSLIAIHWHVKRPQLDAPRGDPRPGPMDTHGGYPLQHPLQGRMAHPSLYQYDPHIYPSSSPQHSSMGPPQPGPRTSPGHPNPYQQGGITPSQMAQPTNPQGSFQDDRMRAPQQSASVASIPFTMAKRQKTGETTEPPKDDTPSTSGQTSNLTLELNKVITKVADAISNDDDLMRLGLELGVEQQHIDRALATNWTGGEKSSHGNLVMLQNWAKNVKQSEQLPTLRASLREAKLIGVEEICLPIEGSTTSGKYEYSIPDNIPFDRPTDYQAGPGYVLFINNFFTGTTGHRNGAQFDEKNIKNLFKNVLKDYYLEYKEDVSLNKLQGYLTDLKNTLSTGSYKSFIFILGTHGGPKTDGPDGRMKDAVQMADGKLMLVENIVSNFHGDQIPAMKDKPKVFIIQSCRGEKKQRSVHSSDNAATVSYPKTKNYPRSDPQPAYRPVNSDILIAYASSEGTKAWRNEDKGSWFVTDLCNVITECYDKENMLNILVRVNGRMVCREEKSTEQECIKQMPCFLCTFTRRFMLAYPSK